jgi:hypothetical protein
MEAGMVYLKLLPRYSLGEARKNSKNVRFRANTLRITSQTYKRWIHLHLRLYSPLLDLGRFYSSLIFYTVGRTPWTGDRPVARPLMHTGEHKHRINAQRHPCLKWDSNPWSQCLSGRRQFISPELDIYIISEKCSEIKSHIWFIYIFCVTLQFLQNEKYTYIPARQRHWKKGPFYPERKIIKTYACCHFFVQGHLRPCSMRTEILVLSVGVCVWWY